MPSEKVLQLAKLGPSAFFKRIDKVPTYTGKVSTFCMIELKYYYNEVSVLTNFRQHFAMNILVLEVTLSLLIGINKHHLSDFTILGLFVHNQTTWIYHVS